MMVAARISRAVTTGVLSSSSTNPRPSFWRGTIIPSGLVALEDELLLDLFPMCAMGDPDWWAESSSSVSLKF